MPFRLAASERLERAAKAFPGEKPAAWRAASRYVAGRSQAEALHTAADLLDGGHGVSVDLFGDPRCLRTLAGYSAYVARGLNGLSRKAPSVSGSCQSAVRL